MKQLLGWFLRVRSGSILYSWLEGEQPFLTCNVDGYWAPVGFLLPCIPPQQQESLEAHQ
jgi:hypothetical protein